MRWGGGGVEIPRNKGGGGGPYTLAGRRGGGGSIFWKTRDIGLASYSNNLSTVEGLGIPEGGYRRSH